MGSLHNMQMTRIESSAASHREGNGMAMIKRYRHHRAYQHNAPKTERGETRSVTAA